MWRAVGGTALVREPRSAGVSARVRFTAHHSGKPRERSVGQRRLAEPEAHRRLATIATGCAGCAGSAATAPAPAVSVGAARDAAAPATATAASSASTSSTDATPDADRAASTDWR